MSIELTIALATVGGATISAIITETCHYLIRRSERKAEKRPPSLQDHVLFLRANYNKYKIKKIDSEAKRHVLQTYNDRMLNLAHQILTGIHDHVQPTHLELTILKDYDKAVRTFEQLSFNLQGVTHQVIRDFCRYRTPFELMFQDTLRTCLSGNPSNQYTISERLVTALDAFTLLLDSVVHNVEQWSNKIRTSSSLVELPEIYRAEATENYTSITAHTAHTENPSISIDSFIKHHREFLTEPVVLTNPFNGKVTWTSDAEANWEDYGDWDRIEVNQFHVYIRNSDRGIESELFKLLQSETLPDLSTFQCFDGLIIHAFIGNGVGSNDLVSDMIGRSFPNMVPETSDKSLVNVNLVYDQMVGKGQSMASIQFTHAWKQTNMRTRLTPFRLNSRHYLYGTHWLV